MMVIFAKEHTHLAEAFFRPSAAEPGERSVYPAGRGAEPVILRAYP